MRKVTKHVRLAAAAALLTFAAACGGDADTDQDLEGSGDNTIMPAGDQTGGAGDMGTGTGTAAPGTDMPPVGAGAAPDTSALTTTPGSTTP